MHKHERPDLSQSSQAQSRNDAAAWSEAACHCTCVAAAAPVHTRSDCQELSLPEGSSFDDAAAMLF